MKKGKIPYNSLIRSVLRVPFERKETDHIARDGFSIGAGKIGEAVNTGIYSGKDAAPYIFYRTLNSARAFGIRPEKIMISLTLPESMTEPGTKMLMQKFKSLAGRENAEIAGGSTCFSSAVTRPVITLAAAGEEITERRAPQAGDALILTKYAGNAGAYLIKEELYPELAARFSPAFLSECRADEEALSCRKETEALSGTASTFHDVSEGGIFASLYEFAEGYKCGFCVDLKRIPVRQETVEICEHFDLNPYTLLSTGCMLIAAADAEEALERLEKAEVPAVQIGEIIKGKQKILTRGEEERFLERPERDGIYILENYG